ncbi:hypothetical protein NY406_02430 [Chlorobaculum sp. MV4-Y]|uniref:hypothetical protein n=1 Tax=Chlorobaculum sp. MV4-Y TaxID=2976335 RepID=UPI0021AF0354|nr:hypothetical protein [Chlorobaculum sp. MV4-Y]UWX58150.1 hypothetical protein NY406_02430 [Chlorobaculum sp. MV4-Y]
MSSNESMPAAPELQAPKKKGPKVIATLFVMGLIVVLTGYLWINWKKPRIEPEPLSPELTTIIQNMPGTSDAMIYVGLKDIRESKFWKEAVPDSVKNSPLISLGKRTDSLMKAGGIDLNNDLDTLLVSFQRSGRKQQNYIGLAFGPIARKTQANLLDATSIQKAVVAGHRAYMLDSALWVSPMGENRLAIASSTDNLEKFFRPSGHLFERDSTTASLISKTPYKSHAWFALASPQWTAGALQSLTSKNSEVKSVGNLNRLQQISMSVKFDDSGLKGQSEWVYKDRQAAFFASTFLWGAIELSSISGSRTSESAKELLKHLKVSQNLESVIVTADLPETIFKKSGKKE